MKYHYFVLNIMLKILSNFNESTNLLLKVSLVGPSFEASGNWM